VRFSSASSLGEISHPRRGVRNADAACTLRALPESHGMCQRVSLSGGLMSLDIANMIAELRVLCGLAFIPHILAKIFKREMTLGFFQAAGFRPAAAFMYFGLLVEVLASVSLCAGFLVPYAAAIAAIFMLVAGGAAFKVSRRQWFWNLGGCEYHVFWGCVCAIVALHS